MAVFFIGLNFKKDFIINLRKGRIKVMIIQQHKNTTSSCGSGKLSYP